MSEKSVLSDRYELQHELGRGGMGTVHRAVDLRLRRVVAVKTLSAELAHDANCRARLEREAHAVAALNHPAVATIHDVAEDLYDGAVVPYLVMEYVDGVTLADLLRDGPLQIDRAVDLVLQVLDALDHSHRHGILHRDVKAANIMITPSGAVKVLDFGIAKALTEAATRLTGTGMAVGTPASLAPEQINGVDVDHRADLYAVGCLLYQLLTGGQPFSGDSPFTIMHQHLTADPLPPSLRRPGVSAALDAVVLTALRKDPADRYPDAATMRAALSNPAVTGAGSATVQLSSLPSPRSEPGAAGSAPPLAPTLLQPAPVQPAAAGSASESVASESTRSWAAISFRPTAEGMIAVLGCLLAAVCARMGYVEAPHFAVVALVAALLGAVALLWSARLACVVAWGPVAETLAVQQEFRRAYLGWDTKPVLLALGLAAVAGVCAFRVLSRRGTEGGFAAVGAWFAGTTALWFFLDDQAKTAVFYALLLAATLGVGTTELLRRLRPVTRSSGRSPTSSR